MRAATVALLDQTLGDTTPEGAPARIGRLREDADFSFIALRRLGIAQAQALSGELWTDYNHHDPGVTLLEALCFALTESVFGAETPLTDLLTAPDGRIHYRRHALHSAEEALPCRPSTELDWQRYLLDRVPMVRQLRLQMPAQDGRWQLALRAPAGLGDAAARAAAQAYWAQRNLGEDLCLPVGVLQPRWCKLQLALSVDGARELNDILLELVQRAAVLIGASPQRQSPQTRLREAAAAGMPLDSSALFEGPALQHGWIAGDELSQEPDKRLYFSDLARALSEIDGVVTIHRLGLQLIGAEAEADEGDSLAWSGPDWALELRWPEQVEDVQDWQLSRRGSRLSLDVPAFLQRLEDERQTSRLASMLVAGRRAAPRLLPRPSGQYRAPLRYLSSWQQLPPLYRAAHSRPATSAEGEAQFAGYLALLEQWLAHGEAQLPALRNLFSLSRDASHSYAWDELDASQLPGLSDLYLDEAAMRAQLRADSDPVLERRSRVLDLLLALHGESCAQNSIQRFGCYYSAASWQAHLYECKRRLLLRIVRHTRDRAGGIDYSRASLGRKGNTAALQERVSLLLGFSHSHSRLLSGELATLGMSLDESPRAGPASAPPPDATALALWQPLRARLDAQYAQDVADGRVAARLGHYFTALDLQALPAALLRCAAHAERYLSSTDAQQPLWLGPDEHGHWWPLAVRPGPAGVLPPALYLHEFACRLQREAEGLHLVEHVLLRPQGQLPLDAAANAFHAQRLSLVFTGWTARGAEQSFRDLAAETVALACPAHLHPQLFWPDAAQLARFEALFSAWLHARQAHCHAWIQGDEVSNTAATQELDQCAAALRTLLESWEPASQAEAP